MLYALFYFSKVKESTYRHLPQDDKSTVENGKKMNLFSRIFHLHNGSIGYLLTFPAVGNERRFSGRHAACVDSCVWFC